MSPGQYELIPRKGGAGKCSNPLAHTPISSICQQIFKGEGSSLTPVQSSLLTGQAEGTEALRFLGFHLNRSIAVKHC